MCRKDEGEYKTLSVENNNIHLVNRVYAKYPQALKSCIITKSRRLMAP
ncbi:hypothetical protein GTGU_03785 [Trabulsiella guamensis ATCC 49490]|uniref:Uncharacterized protein n=1 Tax=Trabulsiella guamensis ATCC 49490 TaxID=1005994 RepID=A0A084ZS40_9ENTR|nr:hypothetical protein GTGU_03785 [Trabulsiella guamensis ATCC 49490]